MRTQIRTIALATATVVVLAALLVLFVRVRSEPEIVVPEDALSAARARYERTRAGAGQADRGGATSHAVGPSADQPSMEERRQRRSTSNVRPGSGSPEAGKSRAVPPPSAAPASPRSGHGVISQGEVRTAYDSGDFESALELAEKFLHQSPRDAYANYVKRVAAVSACALGEEAVARKHYGEMVARDQPVVAKRCRRYGIQF